MEALKLAILSYPLMLLEVITLDLKFIVVMIMPRMVSFLGLESIMPQYRAYRCGKSEHWCHNVSDCTK
jgi:hypothetical protein